MRDRLGWEKTLLDPGASVLPHGLPHSTGLWVKGGVINKNSIMSTMVVEAVGTLGLALDPSMSTGVVDAAGENTNPRSHTVNWGCGWRGDNTNCF